MAKISSTLLRLVAALALLLCTAWAQPIKNAEPSLTQSQASHFASLALKCIQKEYPNKPDHTINDKDDVRNPRAMHPAFYGCLDWHSTVHGHWMLVHLLRLFPNLPEAKTDSDRPECQPQREEYCRRSRLLKAS